MARRRPEAPLKRVADGHYEGWGYKLSRNSKGTWELIHESDSEPKFFSLRKKAVEFVEGELNKTVPGWRPAPRQRVLWTVGGRPV